MANSEPMTDVKYNLKFKLHILEIMATLLIFLTIDTSTSR